MSARDKASDLLDSIGLPVEINDFVKDSKTRAVASVSLNVAIEDLPALDLSALDNFGGHYALIRIQDEQKFWHSVTGLADSPAELRKAFELGARRMASLYGKDTKIIAVEFYVTEI